MTTDDSAYALEWACLKVLWSSFGKAALQSLNYTSLALNGPAWKQIAWLQTP